MNKQEILEILEMPAEAFYNEIAPKAFEQFLNRKGRTLDVYSMLGYSNICKNRCLYCGMRAGSPIPRYRMTEEEILDAGLKAALKGFHHLFLISGEDPGYSFDALLRIVEKLHENGLSLSLAIGEMEPEKYLQLHAAGAEEYVMKFEMSHEDSFNRLNPSTNFRKRMDCIEKIAAAGLKLASGNIVDWPGQTLDELADDIVLMQELKISWAPVIPYMPAKGTPLALEGGPGSLEKIHKEIAILRLSMPDIQITAQQPGRDLKKGLADTAGNLEAIRCGANLLFYDLLPEAQAKDFHVIDERNLTENGRWNALAEAIGGNVRK